MQRARPRVAQGKDLTSNAHRFTIHLRTRGHFRFGAPNSSAGLKDESNRRPNQERRALDVWVGASR